MGLRKHHWRSSQLHNKHTAINHHNFSKLLSSEISHDWKHSTATKLSFREEYSTSRTSVLTAGKHGAMTGALLGWWWWWLTGMRFRGWFRLGQRWQAAFCGKLACCRAPQDTARSAAGSNLRSRFAVERKKNGKSKHLTGCLSQYAQPQNQAKERYGYKIERWYTATLWPRRWTAVCPTASTFGHTLSCVALLAESLADAEPLGFESDSIGL